MVSALSGLRPFAKKAYMPFVGGALAATTSVKATHFQRLHTAVAAKAPPTDHLFFEITVS
ncbi:hypothetical protein PSCICO_01640 [Pseudomonas cichorii]|nr:hypothetical protein PSCICO_01640 [Pseudomonas cichorii]